MSSKRPADEAKESPAQLKHSKADDAYLTAVQAETDRIEAERKRRAAQEHIPIAPFSEAEVTACLENLKAVIVQARAQDDDDDEDDSMCIPYLDYKDEKNSYFVKIFRGSPRVFLWYAEMESKKGTPSASAWVRAQCKVLLKPVVERWNQEHERFKLVLTDWRRIELVDLAKTPNLLAEKEAADKEEDDDE